MATYSVAASKVAAHNKTLVANTVDTVQFVEGPTRVTIISDGAAAIYVTVDGTTPTIGGSSTYLIPAVACAREIHAIGVAEVKLISSGTPTYSVEAMR